MLERDSEIHLFCPFVCLVKHDSILPCPCFCCQLIELIQTVDSSLTPGFPFLTDPEAELSDPRSWLSCSADCSE